MTRGEGRRPKIDFALFWERQWKKNLDITPPLFKGEAFGSMFGEDARGAIQIYIHFQVHDVSTYEDKRQLEDALAVLKKHKLDPKQIISGRGRAGIAKLPPEFKP